MAKNQCARGESAILAVQSYRKLLKILNSLSKEQIAKLLPQ